MSTVVIEIENRSFSSGETSVYAFGSGCPIVAELAASRDELRRPELGGRAKVSFLAHERVRMFETAAEALAWLEAQ